MASNFNFQCALITGGGGGIGKYLAQYFLTKGKKVILAGRTESNLRDTAREIGATAYYVVDTGDISSLPAFVERIFAEHPDLDCIVNNAGIQKPLSFTKDKAEDFLTQADQEIDINIRGPMRLVLHSLPHLRARPSAVIINVSSILGFSPAKHDSPVYNGTKAFLHSFTMNLRTQLKDEPKLRVIEVAPPMVGTDLHRDAEDPDDNKKHKNKIALTVEEFMEEVGRQMEEGKDVITAGPGKKIVGTWYENMFQFYKSDV